MLRSILGLLLLPLVLAEQKCQEHPNYQTKAYTYIICSGTSATNLNSSRVFCQAYANGTDVVTFPNQEEYEFMASKVNETMDNSFMYIPGFFQKADASDRFDPSTGEYYWTSDLDTVITVTSPTYWEPFREFITNFDSVRVAYAFTATFLLDANGNRFLGESLGGGPLRTPLDGDVVCMKSGIPPKPKNPTSSTSTDDEFR